MRPVSRRFRQFAVAAVTGTAAALIPAGMAAASAAAPAAPTAAPAAPTAAPAASTLRIHTILGSGHLPPYAGQTVSGVSGVVTGVTSSYFCLQDPDPSWSAPSRPRAGPPTPGPGSTRSRTRTAVSPAATSAR